MPKINQQEYLTFEFLEDIMNLPRQEYEEKINNAQIVRISPLIEYTFHHYGDHTLLLMKHSPAKEVKFLNQIVNLPNLLHLPQNTSLEAQQLEYFKPPQDYNEFDDYRWNAFLKRFENAATKAGLEHNFAQALTGTLYEMVSNVNEHSEKPETALVGYRWKSAEFEYVIADAGIGVLSSLRKHLDYQFLSDSGDALKTAVTKGESRHGRSERRGQGFEILLNNIACRNSYLRFRSGDHSLTIDGTQFPIRRNIDQCAPFQGFLISVVCKLPKF
jgi:hypothetical protein